MATPARRKISLARSLFGPFISSLVMRAMPANAPLVRRPDIGGCAESLSTVFTRRTGLALFRAKKSGLGNHRYPKPAPEGQPPVA